MKEIILLVKIWKTFFTWSLKLPPHLPILYKWLLLYLSKFIIFYNYLSCKWWRGRDEVSFFINRKNKKTKNQNSRWKNKLIYNI